MIYLNRDNPVDQGPESFLMRVNSNLPDLRQSQHTMQATPPIVSGTTPDLVPDFITEEALRRFDVPGPRYTSYPTADRFVDAFGEEQYLQVLAQRAQGAMVGGEAPLSVYVHIPFCESVCYYCACNKVITKHHERAAEYLDALRTEMDSHAGAFEASAPGLAVASGRRVSHLSERRRTDALDGRLARLLPLDAQCRGVDRSGSAHRHAAAPGAFAQHWFQSDQLRCAGL